MQTFVTRLLGIPISLVIINIILLFTTITIELNNSKWILSLYKIIRTGTYFE